MSHPSRFALPLVAVAALGCGTEAPEQGSGTSGRPDPGLANGSFTAELDGVRIHYEVHGSGPVLMTVPNSWGLSLEGLRAMYRRLEERLTLVYFDPRGMGESQEARTEADRGPEAVRADFHALRQHLGLDSVNAIGWSNGGANLIYLAHQRPQSLSSAIFVHIGASFTAEDARRFQEEHPELAERMSEAMAAIASDEGLSVEEKTARLRSLWLEEYFPGASADPEAARPLLSRAFSEAEFSWRHAAYTQRTWPTFDARQLLPGIDVRSLVVAGAHDLVEPRRVRELADGLPDAEFLVFESSGHFAPLEEPVLFREAVFEFLGVDG